MTTEATPADALLRSPVRRAIVGALAAGRAPGVIAEHTAADLAEVVGRHVTTVRFHLDRLVAAGLVASRFRPRATVGRPHRVYSLVGASSPAEERTEVESLRLLSGLLVAALAPGEGAARVTPVEAGRRWALAHVPVLPDDRPAETAGRWLAKLSRVVEVLEAWGYRPEVSTRDDGRTADLTLAHCPFRDLARENEAVVCGIHRGLIAGSLERLGEQAVRVGLEPFVGPTTCRAQVTTTTPFDASAPPATATATATKEPA